MAIDPSIVSGVRPIQIDNPLDAYSNALRLRALVGQSNLQDLQLQEGQRTLAQNRAIDEAARNSGSAEEYLSNLQKIAPPMAIKLKGDILQQQETQGKVSKSNLEQQGALAQSFISLPPEQRAAQYPAMVQQLNRILLPGQKPFENEQWNEAYLPNMQKFVSAALTPSQFMERGDYANAASAGQNPAAQAQAPRLAATPVTPQDITDEASGATIRPLQDNSAAATPITQNQTASVDVTAKAPAITPDSLRAQAAAARAQGTKAGMEMAMHLETAANQQEERILQQQGLSQTQAHQKVEEAQGAERNRQRWLEVDPFGTLRSATTNTVGASGKSTAAGQPGADQAVGDDYLSTLPKTLGDQVKALAEGRLAFPAGFALKSPYWQNMLQMVSQYDPSFDAINFNSRAAARKDFTSGNSAKAVTALNTVIGHLDTLSQAADSLKNTNLPAYNSIANWAANNTGDPRVKQFENTRKAVADELTRVWRGTGGAEADIQAWLKTMDAAGSPAQLHGVIKNIGDLLESRINALGDQYSRGMGTTEQGMTLLSPNSRSTLDRLEQKAAGQSTPVQQNTPAMFGNGAFPPPEQRKAGTVYDTPKGKLRWTGTGWVTP